MKFALSDGAFLPYIKNHLEKDGHSVLYNTFSPDIDICIVENRYNLYEWSRLLKVIKKNKIKLINFIMIFIRRIRKSILTLGLCDTIQALMKIILNYNALQKILKSFNDFWTWFYINFKTKRTFNFNGKKYNYFYHKNWITWNNERCVEVPIVWDFVKKYKGKKFWK